MTNRRRADASRMFLLATVIGLVGCVTQVVVAVGHLPPALALVALGCGACALVLAIGGLVLEGRVRVRTAEAVGVAVGTLAIGPVIASVHSGAGIALVVLVAVALVHDLR